MQTLTHAIKPLLLALLVALIALSADTTSADADTDDAPTGHIAFSSNRDGNWEIYVMNADGTGQTRLTNNPADDSDPSWSPDGRRIVFTSTRDGNHKIYVMNADGTDQTRLISNPADDFTPMWSPDGRRIAFSSNRDGNWEIYVMNADGTGQTRLTSSLAREWGPTWSPDGRRIAFTSDRDGNSEIYVMNADGTGHTRLTSNPADDDEPNWSPDGRRIAFESDNGIYVMNTDGTGQTRLTSLGWFPSWSPDGRSIAYVSYHYDFRGDGENYHISVMDTQYGFDRDRLTTSGQGQHWTLSWRPIVDAQPVDDEPTGRIAFVSDRHGNDEIYVMNGDGTEQTRLTHSPQDDSDPIWSPDGRRIAFLSGHDGNRELYVIGADGTGRTRLTNNSADDSEPSWSPDGRRLAFQSDRDGNWEIYVVDADGTGQTRLTTTTGDNWNPQWSPDGRRIAFVSRRAGDLEWGIDVINADGTAHTRLTNPAVDEEPSRSPDGRRIAFESTHDGGWLTYVINADGTAHTRLTNPAVDEEPSWSPDGRRIAFESTRDGNFEVYVMNADGTGHTRLTSNPAVDDGPSWSPDGRRIAFLSHRYGYKHVYVMNADGTGRTQLTYGTKGHWNPSWSPDGRWIAFTTYYGGSREIFVINANGTSLTQLTDGGGWSPSWSPVVEDEPAATPPAPIVRIAAKRHDDGKIEFALQVREGDDWGERILPQSRFSSARDDKRWQIGRWISFSPVSAAGDSFANPSELAGPTVRISVRSRSTDGKVELALQVREGDDWSDRILPSDPNFPASGSKGRWFGSSAINLGAIADRSEARGLSSSPDNREAVDDRDALIALYHASGGPGSWKVKWPLSDPEIPIGEWHGVSLHQSGDFAGRVQHLDLSDNNLQGSLNALAPFFVPFLPELEALSLHGNPLTGCVPSELQEILDLGRAIGETPPELSSGLVSGVLNNSVFNTFAGEVVKLKFGNNAAIGVGAALSAAQLADRMRKYDIGGLGLYPCVPFAPTEINPSHFPSDYPPPDYLLTLKIIPADEQSLETDYQTLLTIREYYVVECNKAPDQATRDACAARFESWRGVSAWDNDEALAHVLENWDGVNVDTFEVNGGNMGLRVDRLDLSRPRNWRGQWTAGALFGGIAPQLGNLGGLRYLNLSRNQLTGSIPPHLGHLAYVGTLALNDNALTSARSSNDAPVPIPPELGNLPRLEELYLQNNNLTGYLPPELNWLTASSLRVMEIDKGEILGCLEPNSKFLKAEVVTALTDTAIATTISLGTFGSVSVSAAVPAGIAKIAGKVSTKVGPAVQAAIGSAPTLAAQVKTSQTARIVAGNVGSMLVEKAVGAIEGPVGEGLSLFFSPTEQTALLLGRLAEFVGWHGLGGAVEMDAVYCQR